MTTIRSQARRAGLLYMLMALTAPIGLMVVPGRVVVTGDAAATAERLRSLESLARIGLASELFHQTVAIFVVLALYRLFRGVSESLARQMVILGALVSVPIMFANAINSIAALVCASRPEFLSAFDPAQLDGLAYLFMRLHARGITVASIFWGLWLFPFALLVVRSGFIPRPIGVLMMIAGVGYLVSATVTLLVPQFAPVVNNYALALELGELPVIFWLLIWGAIGPRAEEPVVES